MENLNNVPSSGTFGGSINQVNHNFGLVKDAIDGLEGRTIRSKGLFPTQAALTAAYPSPIVGDYAYVGDSLPATIYDCVTNGTWHNTGQTGGSESVPLNDYPTRSEMETSINDGLQGQVGYAECNTVAATVRKDVVVNGFKLLPSGGALHIKMNNANTASSATMNISPTSTIVAENTKPLFYNGEPVSANNTWESGEIISVYYDGINYQASNAMGGGSAIGKKKLTPLNGYIDNHGETLGSIYNTGTNATNYRYIKYPASEGDVIMVSGRGISAGLLWGVVGDGDVMIEKSSPNLVADKLVKIMPEGTRFITLNSYTSSNPEWYFAKKGSVGAHEIISESFLYGDLRTLAVGQTYDINENVRVSMGGTLQLSKDVRYLSLNEGVETGDLKVYNGGTYRAIKTITNYSSSKTYSDQECAFGAPAKISLTILRGLVDGTITVNFNGTNHTVNVLTTDTDAEITSNIISALSNVSGWTFSNGESSTVILATSVAHGGFGNTQFSLSAGTNTGVVGVKSVVTNGIADSEEGADDGRSTVLRFDITKGEGYVKLKLGSVVHDIFVADSDTPSTIAGKIAQTSYSGWGLSSENDVVIAKSYDAKTYSTNDFVLTDGVLGVTLSKSILFSGNDSSVCVYDYGNDIWSIIGKDDYVSNTFVSLTINELLSYTHESNLHRLLLDEKRKLAYILGNHEKRIKYYDENKMGSTEAYVIAKALIDLKFNSSSGGDSESTLSGTITTGNSDSMMIIGSSFGAVISAYVIPGKHWTQILDLFSDYVIQNVSADGSSNVDHLMWLRSGRELPYQNTRFALLVNSENLGGGVNVLYKSFVNLANAVRSFGIQPVIGTSHRNGSGFRQYHQYLSSQLRKWCKENNTLFMDAGEYTVASIKDGSGYGSHLNERTSPTVAYAYMDALAGIERPRQSLKLYKLRNDFIQNSLDDLVFMDLYERARRFIPTSSSTTFTNYALISAVLPATSNFLEDVILHISTSYDINVYCLDSNATPYPTPGSTYTRFHISEECSIQAGDKYSYNGTTFTVVNVVTDNPYGEFCDAYCSPALSAADSASGTLVKVSGSGSNNIPFHGFGIASMSEAGTVLNDLGGHWVSVTKDNNDDYELNEKLTKVFYDQVYFLVECQGNFILNEVYVKWKATREKTLFRTAIPDFTVNEFNTKAELISESTFGSAGTTLTKWKDENNVAIVTTSASPIPPKCSSVVTVSNTHKMTTTIGTANLVNGRAVLEVLARHTQDNVTGTSWDWNKVYISLISDTTTTYDYPIGLAWRIVRIPIEIIGLAANGFYSTNLTIYSERAGMQIAKVSLKYI